MSRILLTWELGLNLGHLARLLPIASRLKAHAHNVLVATREIPAAVSVLGSVGIPFVEASHLSHELPLQRRASGYADILLSQGWGDVNVLWGLTQSWLNLMRMFHPDLVVHDYSPTARLATYIANIPAVHVGNGFELPPPTAPLPAFTGFSWATIENAESSEQIAVRNATAVAARFGHRGIAALRNLFDDSPSVLATFPELDHYGPRQNGCYIGPLLPAINAATIDWPEGRRRAYAYLRPDTENVKAILGGLRSSDISAVCFAPGFTQERLEAFRSSRICFTSRPIDLKHLTSDAGVCISYGAEGTVAAFMLAGVPQLICPWHVVHHMAARRIEALGAGIVLRGAHTRESVVAELERVFADHQFKIQAQVFAERHRRFSPEGAADAATRIIESKLH
jgi:UDP:flavonoid glycosyltransferase YjiC (YdhE family)